MAFSLPQRIKLFQPMVDRAWAAFCRRECITEETRASKDSWYRAELMKAFGVSTTKRLRKGKDFDKAMAHFEELADDGSIEWQMKLLNGDDKRARHRLWETCETMRFTPEYIAAIAEQMNLRTPTRELNASEALSLRLALLYHVCRKQDRAVENFQSTRPESTPTPKGQHA
jgi:hypothetical protein